MEALFTKDYELLWAVLLALALLLPVRQLIWVLYVRRAQRQGEASDVARQRLKRRASITAALLCFIFAYLYTNYLFQGRP
jgi:uncharacterized paraquat-inducible protein A